MHNVNFLLFQARSLKKTHFWENLLLVNKWWFSKGESLLPDNYCHHPRRQTKNPKPPPTQILPPQQSLNLETILQSKPGWKQNNNKISSFSLKVERHMQFFLTSGEAQDEIPRVRQKSHSNCNHQSFLLFTLGGRKMLERLEIRNALEILFQ